MIDIKDLLYKMLLFIDNNLLLVLVGLLVYYVIISVSFYAIYKKVDLDSKKAIIPALNIISFLEFVSLTKLLIILFVVLYINLLGIIIGEYVFHTRVGRIFKKGALSKLLLGLFPVVFLPLLATFKEFEYEKLDEEEVEEEEEEEETFRYSKLYSWSKRCR